MTVRSSSVILPHFSLILPSNCFQLPLIWSQFMTNLLENEETFVAQNLAIFSAPHPPRWLEPTYLWTPFASQMVCQVHVTVGCRTMRGGNSCRPRLLPWQSF